MNIPIEAAAEPQNEQRFQTLLEQAPFSVQLLSVNGRTLKVNQAWKDLWGTQDGDPLLEFVLTEYDMLADPQLEATGVTPHLRRAFAGEAVRLAPAYYDPAELGKPGRARWVQATARPIKADDGRVIEVMLIHEDVTERLLAERQLRASEMRLRQLANTIPQMAWIADAQGSVEWYNDRWFEYTGTSLKEMAGWGWQSVMDAGVLTEVLQKWRHCIATAEPFQMTFPIRSRAGEYRPFFTLVAPLKDDAGQVIQWFGTNTDVSLLQEAERALRESEAKFRTIADAMPQMVWSALPDGFNDYFNQQWYAYTGFLEGSTDGGDWSGVFHPDDLPHAWARWRHCLATGEVYEVDYRMRHHSGEYRWTLGRALPVRDDLGVITRWMGTCTDIHDQKLAEAELRQSNQHKDEFLAMLAHELRNPLAPISTAAQLLQLSAGNAPRLLKVSEIINRQVAHMTELVDDLLDVSRVTRGLVELQTETLDVKQVVASAVEQAQPIIEARGHALVLRLGSTPAFVEGDKTRLVQVLSNLLNNAAKYTPQNGEIVLGLEVSENQVHLKVSDNGSGMAPGLLPYVFELFTQGARTPDRSQGGLGLGLALVKNIIILHGGAVEAKSAGLGKGSVFTVRLPLVKQRTETGAQLQDQPLQRGQEIMRRPPLCFMIVDDNLDAAQMLANLLEAKGHHALVHGTAESALQDKATPDVQVFILDIGLPGMDGYELARRLRANPATQNATLAALTGYGEAHDLLLSKTAGFHHYFVKPLNLLQLNKLLNEPRLTA